MSDSENNSTGVKRIDVWERAEEATFAIYLDGRLTYRSPVDCWSFLADLHGEVPVRALDMLRAAHPLAEIVVWEGDREVEVTPPDESPYFFPETIEVVE